MLRRLILPLCFTAAGLLGGCARPAAPSTFVIEPAQYAAAFDAAREALRAHRFELDRVDAAGGVITTSPAPGAGFATPWIDHTDTVEDGLKSTINDERRVATVVFSLQGANAEAPADLRLASQPLDVSVRVSVERLYRPGRRPDATGVRLGSFATDPELVARGEQPWYATHVRDDDRLAGRIARAIMQGSHVEPKAPGAP